MEINRLFERYIARDRDGDREKDKEGGRERESYIGLEKS